MSCKGIRVRHRWFRAMTTDGFHHRVGYDKPLSTDWCFHCKKTRAQINKSKRVSVAV